MLEAPTPQNRKHPQQTAIMKGLLPAPKGRARNPVGHKYLEALQVNFNGDSKSSSSESPPPDYRGLDLLILGLTSGTAMDDIDFALCRFTQAVPEAPLHLDIIQVGRFVLPQGRRQLTRPSTIQLLCRPRSEPTSSPCYERTPLRRV